jgi:glycerol-3-phosphate dehydrogenase (NAD(P)+)
MKSHVLVLGFGVASTAYVSVLDFNKIKTSVIGSPFDIKNIKNVKKKNKIFNINFSKNINFFYDYELGSIDIKSINLIIVGTNTNGIPWITKILNQIKKNCPILLITKGIINYKSKIIPISKYISLKCSSNKVVMASGRFSHLKK